MRIICASSSKNREELFKRMKFSFQSVAPDFLEIIDKKLSPTENVKKFAYGKALSVFPKFKNEKDIIIMGFDSVSVFDNKIYGKPKSKKEAFEMIQIFRGQEQEIISGVSIIGNWHGKYFKITDYEITKIFFRNDFTNCQIRKYLEFDDYRDKCGAYSILGPGQFFIKKIEGDFQNVVGVPVFKLTDMIQKITGKNPLGAITVR
jgi:septum formation protein